MINTQAWSQAVRRHLFLILLHFFKRIRTHRPTAAISTSNERGVWLSASDVFLLLPFLTLTDAQAYRRHQYQK